ncbi:TlpA family protein disulfide reductase [Bacteroides sp. 214]|uniref:peroxiredoxin family protein n=1 Tax=Bacteroides sp. 214 TaxID=2302935 RepID=UPI0013D7B18C|nr:TlpA disulfide reductase family protein [Bacteroides sp. 214]NDW11946.1 TlpA family protein disulfide reductase [Bacteroides sp. 214]
MKTRQPVLLFLLLSIAIAGCKGTKDKNDYLREVLSNLEKIKTATYCKTSETWQPGDTVAMMNRCLYVKEYSNPQDTTIGSSYVSFDCADTTKLFFGYDGTIRVSLFHDDKEVLIDDFTTKAHFPYRPLTPPFFNYARSIIDYALTTEDSITLEMEDIGDEYYVKLTVYEDEQIEFFGKAYRMTDVPYVLDPTSIYELWISKKDNLPYKTRREMSHDISVTICSNVEFNKLSIEDLHIDHYYPQDYEIRLRGKKRVTSTKEDLTGKQAPDWTLNNMHEQPVSLSDFKSKVLLINFTGIGCGPCQASIPFLKQLKEHFSPEEFDLVAIETWVRKSHSYQNYTAKNNLNYTFLGATDEVIKQYRTGGGAPFFFILDEQRVVRKVVFGYSKERTDKEITDAITALL